MQHVALLLDVTEQMNQASLCLPEAVVGGIEVTHHYALEVRAQYLFDDGSRAAVIVVEEGDVFVAETPDIAGFAHDLPACFVTIEHGLLAEGVDQVIVAAVERETYTVD